MLVIVLSSFVSATCNKTYDITESTSGNTTHYNTSRTGTIVDNCQSNLLPISIVFASIIFLFAGIGFLLWFSKEEKETND